MEATATIDPSRAKLLASLEARNARVAAKAAKKAAKEAAAAQRESDKAEKVAAVARCAELSRKPPAGHQEWGYVRTHAWSAAAKVCARLAANSRPSLAKLRKAIASIESTLTAPLEELVSPKETA